MLFGRIASGLALGAVIFAVSPSLSTACITHTAAVDDLYMSLDADGSRKRSEFTTDTAEIHCIAEVANHRPDATFTLRLSSLQLYNFQTHQYFDSVRRLGQLELHPEPSDAITKLDAQLKKTHPGGNDGGASAGDMNTDESAIPYDAGRFVCEIFLDKDPDTSSPDMSVTFNVNIPPCPSVTIVAGTACYGFFEADTKCPEFGLTSTEPAQCRCDKTAGWDCPQ